jgi:hypothetical protein
MLGDTIKETVVGISTNVPFVRRAVSDLVKILCLYASTRVDIAIVAFWLD